MVSVGVTGEIKEVWGMQVGVDTVRASRSGVLGVGVTGAQQYETA